LWSQAAGVGTVGDDEHAIALMMGTKGGRWQAIPFRIKPARGQVSENSVHPPSKERCDVFHDDVARL
jgi:hypothetical protein